MTSVVLNVPSISCGHCARKITNALTPVAGVRDVQVNVTAKQVG
jgi:copper chaperone CopZ